MSYTYGFFDAVDLGSGNYDRVYSSAEFSHYWALLVGDGVFGQPSTSLNILANTPVAMSVKVSPGTGWIKGHYLTVPDNMDEVIAVPVANPSLPRIDSIIMALDNTDRMMKLYVRSGTAAASPQPVSLQRDADLWELELAQVTVAAGAGNITQAAIKDMRTDSTRCGIVTGLVDQFDVTGFFTAAQASFDEWFENIQNQLGDDVAGNLLNLIQGLQESKLDVSAKASSEEAIAGTDDTKYMTPKQVKLVTDPLSNPLFIMAIGDIYHSANNIEEQTDGSFIGLDGRTIDVDSTYPLLKNIYELKYRWAPPSKIPSSGVSWSSNYHRARGVYLGGSYFFTSEYAQSTNSRNYHSLLRRDSSGNITKLLSNEVGDLVVCNNNVIAFTQYDYGAHAVVYNSSGSKLKDITLNSSTSLRVLKAYERDGKVVVVYFASGSVYSYYSTDNFSTYGTSTFDGTSNLSSRRPIAENNLNYQTSFCGLQEYNSDLYMLFFYGTTLYLYKSTNMGTTWTQVGTAEGYNQSGGMFLIHQGYVYVSGYKQVQEGSSTTNHSVIYKYNLSMSLQKTSGYFLNDSFNYCSGFVRNNKLYLFYSESEYLLMDLDTLEFTSSYFSVGSSKLYPKVNGAFMDYTTKDGEFYFLASGDMIGMSTYQEMDGNYYGGLFIFHIPSGKWVLMFPIYQSTSSSNISRYPMCGLCEDEDGNIYFNTGYRNDNTFYNYSTYKLQRSLKLLPYLDYAYLKAKEVTP